MCLMYYDTCGCILNIKSYNYITTYVVVCTTIDFFFRSALFIQNQPPPGGCFYIKTDQ